MKKVKKGDSVSIEYEGRLESGETVERSADTGPVEFEVGASTLPPGFEKALLGMSPGEEKTVTLPPDEAFGPRDEELVHTVKRNVLGATIEPKPGMVLGMTLEKDGQSHKVPAMVTAVAEEVVTIDFNHPLAGKTVLYTLKLKEIKS
jgi:FKBP-type peptidyl-prolyl cis-trans isomerase 2